MSLRADLSGAWPVAAIEALAPTESTGTSRQELLHRLQQFDLGKRFQGEILSRLKDGSFVVKVADAAVRMNLPDGVQAGDPLDLTLISLQPRPTFLLGSPRNDAGASLSSAARLIDSMLQTARKENAPAALHGASPLLPSSLSDSTDTSHIAAALKNALAFSGMFYESHLSQWVDGRRTLQDVLREPQAMNATPGQIAPAPADAKEGFFTRLLHGAAELADPAAPAHAAARHDTASASAGEPAKLVPLQLEALEQRRIHWQGELWPGQPMQWEISEDEAGSSSTAVADAERHWRSEVHFDLPALGAVSASIQLAGDRVQVQVRAGSDDTAAQLRTGSAALIDALEAAGIHLDLLTVRQDEAAGLSTPGSSGPALHGERS